MRQKREGVVPKEDPRVLRTRKLLQDAFIELMGGHSFESITVQDITDAARVNHATFYRHYRDKHDLADAIFIPGLYPFAMQTTDATTDLVIQNGTAQIRVQKAGTFLIENDAQELFSILDDLASACSEIANSAGPTFNAAAFTAIQSRIDALKGS